MEGREGRQGWIFINLSKKLYLPKGRELVKVPPSIYLPYDYLTYYLTIYYLLGSSLVVRKLN